MIGQILVYCPSLIETFCLFIMIYWNPGNIYAVKCVTKLPLWYSSTISNFKSIWFAHKKLKNPYHKYIHIVLVLQFLQWKFSAFDSCFVLKIKITKYKPRPYKGQNYYFFAIITMLKSMYLQTLFSQFTDPVTRGRENIEN